MLLGIGYAIVNFEQEDNVVRARTPASTTHLHSKLPSYFSDSQRLCAEKKKSIENVNSKYHCARAQPPQPSVRQKSLGLDHCSVHRATSRAPVPSIPFALCQAYFTLPYGDSLLAFIHCLVFRPFVVRSRARTHRRKVLACDFHDRQKLVSGRHQCEPPRP